MTEIPPEHFHVWRVAATGTAAFMSRAYLKRPTAAHAAARWGLPAFRFVQRCGLGDSCPRKPPILRGAGPGVRRS